MFHLEAHSTKNSLALWSNLPKTKKMKRIMTLSPYAPTESSLAIALSAINRNLTFTLW